MTALTTGPWTPLGEGAGNQLAVAGPAVAAARLGFLTVWTGGEPLVAEAPLPTPGGPRLVGGDGGPGRAVWGVVDCDLAAGRVRLLDGLVAAVADDRPHVPVAPRGGGRRPTCFAWDPDGSAVLVAVQETGAAEGAGAAVRLHGVDGEILDTLWEGSDLAPRACWLGRDLAVAGLRRPLVFDRSGASVATLEGTTPPVRIDATASDDRLLVVENAAIRLFDRVAFDQPVVRPGAWLDAALGPGHDTVLAVDLDGQIHVLDAALRPTGRLGAPGPVDALAVDGRRVVVATASAIHVAEFAR